MLAQDERIILSQRAFEDFLKALEFLAAHHDRKGWNLTYYPGRIGSPEAPLGLLCWVASQSPGSQKQRLGQRMLEVDRHYRLLR